MFTKMLSQIRNLNRELPPRRGVPAGEERPMGNADTGMTLTQCMPVVGGARSSYTPISVAAVAG